MFQKIRIIFLFFALATSAHPYTSTHREPILKRSWEEICSASKNAVFQIFSSRVQYDLGEPYNNPERAISCGTGFCIDPSGLVVTNYHVIANAVAIFAQLPAIGKEKLELKLVGTCPNKDVALLRFTDNAINLILKQLNVEQLPFLLLGDSNDLRESQEIMSLGYPLGQENLKCSLGNNAGRETFNGNECIQTTTPLNHGNSGGPLFSDQGVVIGICVGGCPGADGVNFVIPINALLVLLEELKQTTLIRLPEWGADVNPTSKELLIFLTCPYDGGVYVHHVSKGSVSEKAGIEAGDIIFALNGALIDYNGLIQSSNDSGKTHFTEIIYRQPMRTTSILSIYRNGKTIELPVTLYPANRLAIDYIFTCIDNLPDCEVIGGLVITEICMQHIDHLKKCAVKYNDSKTAITASKYDNFENRQKERVGVTRIIPYSEAFKATCFNDSPITILKKINDQEVFTVNDVRKAILSGINNDFVSFEAEDGKLMVLSTQKIMAEIPQLMTNYGIPLSPFIEDVCTKIDEKEA